MLSTIRKATIWGGIVAPLPDKRCSMPICMLFHGISPSLMQAKGFVIGSSRNPIGVTPNRLLSLKANSSQPDGSQKIRSLSIREPSKAKTVGVVGLGSTLKRVEEEFGVAEKVEEGGKVHWYWKKGIEFSYDADAKVKSISIFKRTGAAPAGFDETILREQVWNVMKAVPETQAFQAEW